MDIKNYCMYSTISKKIAADKSCKCFFSVIFKMAQYSI